MSEMNQHDIPPPRRDESDAMLDANLHALGARTGMVPAPSADELRAWRTNGAAAAPALRLAESEGAAPARPPHSPHAWRRPRWVTMLTAAAACVAAAVGIFIQPWSSRVEASTIIKSLRAKDFGGMNIRFDHVSSAGTTIDGTIYLRLKRAISLDRLDEPGVLDPENPGHEGDLGAAYATFTVTTDDSVKGMSGARIDAEGALTPASGWMYLHTSDRTATQLSAASPIAAGLATMSQHGVIMNIGGLDDRFFDGLNAMMCPMAQDEGPIRAAVERDADGHGKVSVGMRLGVREHAPSAEQIRRFTSLARTIISGKARKGELDQMRTMLQDDFAQTASVQNLGNGRYLLSAELSDPRAAGHAATLRSLYEESGGVQWAELSNMHGATGTIRFDFAADPIDPALLSYDRLVQTGTTNYLDLRMVMRMFMRPGVIGMWG
jgi:hypothetical protein